MPAALALAVLPAAALLVSDRAVSDLVVSVLVVSGLVVSGLGSTAAGRSTYFGASAACGTSAVRDPSVALAGAVTFVISPPPIDMLRWPACAAADAKSTLSFRWILRT